MEREHKLGRLFEHGNDDEWRRRIVCERRRHKGLGTDVQPTVEFHQMQGNTLPHFSITAEERDPRRRGYGEPLSCGCLHDLVRETHPELAKALPWHLADIRGVPMHYVENAVYWAEQVMGISRWERTPWAPDPREAFRSHVVEGAVRGDSLYLDEVVFAPLPEPQAPDGTIFEGFGASRDGLEVKREWLRKRVERWCLARKSALMRAFEGVCAELDLPTEPFFNG